MPVTPERRQLSSAISKYRSLSNYVGRIDEEIEAKYAAFLRRAGEDRAKAQQRLETARQTNPTPEKRALSAVMQTVERPAPTVAECEAALADLQVRLDEQSNQLDLARREANRIRNTELASAEKQRDAAVGAVIESEGMIADLLSRYAATRTELGRLYLALHALPLNIRPGGNWQAPVSLNDLQQGDRSLANEIRDTVTALQSDPGAPLPTSPSPPPHPEAEAA